MGVYWGRPLGLAPLKRRDQKQGWEAHLSCRALGQRARPLRTCLSQSLDVDMALVGGQLSAAEADLEGLTADNSLLSTILPRGAIWAARLHVPRTVSVSYCSASCIFCTTTVVGARREAVDFDGVVIVRVQSGELRPQAPQGNGHQALTPYICLK